MGKAPSEALMATSKKVKKPAKAKSAEMVDVLVVLAHECENMQKDEAFAALPALLDTVSSNYVKLGGVLAVIRDNGWWEGDYKTFSECLEKQFGLQYRKGAYLIQTYENLIQSGVAWADVKDLGWSKLRVVSSVLTKENVEEWVAKALPLTVLQLYDVVREFKSQTLETTGVAPEDIESTTTSISFKVHQDQKETIKQAVEKARKEAGTEYDAVALEAICINYLSGGKVTKPKSLKSVLSKYTAEEVLNAFGELWPDIDITVESD
jgi:hypothetical protein